MAIAKTLDILLRAPTSKLDADFKRAQGLAKNFTNTLSGLVAGAIGGFTLAGFFSKITEGFQSLDELANRSIRLDIDPTSLMVLGRAATYADTSLDEVEKGSRNLAKNIDAGLKGGKRQEELFQRLGTTATELFAKSLPEQLGIVASGMSKLQNNTERTAVSLALFGKSGAGMLQLMGDNGAWLAQSLEEVQRYANVFTSKELEGIGAANDAWDTLMMTFNGVFQRIAVDLAPAITRLLMVIANGIAPGTFLNGVFSVFGDTLGLVVRLLDILGNELSFTSQILGSFTGRIFGALILSAALIKAYVALAAILTVLRVRTLALAAVEAARIALQKKNLAMSLAVAGLGVAAFAAFSDQINGLIDNLLGAVDAQDNLNAGLGDFDKLQEGISRKNKINLGSAQFGTQAALEQILTVRSDRQGMGEIKGAIDNSNEILEQIRDGLQGVGGIMDGQFEDADL